MAALESAVKLLRLNTSMYRLPGTCVRLNCGFTCQQASKESQDQCQTRHSTPHHVGKEGEGQFDLVKVLPQPLIVRAVLGVLQRRQQPKQLRITHATPRMRQNERVRALPEGTLSRGAVRSRLTLGPVCVAPEMACKANNKQ